VFLQIEIETEAEIRAEIETEIGAANEIEIRKRQI